MIHSVFFRTKKKKKKKKMHFMQIESIYKLKIGLNRQSNGLL